MNENTTLEEFTHFIFKHLELDHLALKDKAKKMSEYCSLRVYAAKSQGLNGEIHLNHS